MIRRDVGDSWSGAGDHEGHMVTAVEKWEPTIRRENDFYVIDSGRVRCSCGVGWVTAIPTWVSLYE